jgi:hypothetical protein
VTQTLFSIHSDDPKVRVVSAGHLPRIRWRHFLCLARRRSRVSGRNKTLHDAWAFGSALVTTDVPHMGGCDTLFGRQNILDGIRPPQCRADLMVR